MKMWGMEQLIKMLLVPEKEWHQLQQSQAEILRLLKDLAARDNPKGKVIPFITAIEFMTAVRIGRTKFDQLVAESKVKTIKKGGRSMCRSGRWRGILAAPPPKTYTLSINIPLRIHHHKDNGNDKNDE
jgi:hypothetical protein